LSLGGPLEKPSPKSLSPTDKAVEDVPPHVVEDLYDTRG
jgi:hypothetical protein